MQLHGLCVYPQKNQYRIQANLAAVLRQMIKGSIVGFDELNHTAFPGETTAVRGGCLVWPACECVTARGAATDRIWWSNNSSQSGNTRTCSICRSTRWRVLPAGNSADTSSLAMTTAFLNSPPTSITSQQPASFDRPLRCRSTRLRTQMQLVVRPAMVRNHARGLELPVVRLSSRFRNLCPITEIAVP